MPKLTRHMITFKSLGAASARNVAELAMSEAYIR